METTVKTPNEIALEAKCAHLEDKLQALETAVLPNVALLLSQFTNDVNAGTVGLERLIKGVEAYVEEKL